MASEEGRVDPETVVRSEPDQAGGRAPARPAAAAAMAGPDPADPCDPEAIRRGIEQTRAEMDSTLDALSDRISPRHLLDELFEFWHGGDSTRGARRGFRETGIRLAESVRDHPVPAALIGAGLVWMLFEDRSPRPRRDAGDFGEEPEEESAGIAARRRSQPAATRRRALERWLDDAPLAAGAAALAAGLAAGLLLPETPARERERSEGD